ncbi:MAG TPA: Ig-like domain-containing protein, partial [Chthoniobacterales bacterium]|nr:Ig-like domain-containing protein [Chthoniobacterales bacterium]
LTLGYAAIAKSRRAQVRQTNNMASVSSMPQTVDLATYHADDEDPALIQKRNAYLNRFYGTGPGQVSIADFAASQAAVRKLPPSPLQGGEIGMLGGEIPAQPWTYPVPPPLFNFWGGGASVRIDAIAVDPTDPDTLYVVSEGGIAKSTDAGESWSYRSDDLSSQSVRSIAIDPEMPSIVYAGTGTAPQYGVGMFRSTDSGATWKTFGKDEFTGGTICKILVDPATAGSESKTTVYASVINAGNHTVWQSDDSGEHWTSVRSVNGAGGGLAHYDLAIDSSGRLYITAPDGVFRRDNPDTRIVEIHSIAAAQAHAPSFLAVDNQDVVYLAYKDGPAVNVWTVKIAKSSDYGDNWTELNPSGADLYCFGVDPANPDRIFVGGYPQPPLYDLRYTLNGGTSWLSIGGVHVDSHAIAFCPTNPPGAERYYLGTDGGIHRADYDFTVPPPSTVDFISKNQNLAGILTGGVGISRDDRIFIGTQDNANQLSRPVNPPWVPVYPYVGYPLLGGDGTRGFIEMQNNDETMYAVTYFFSTVSAQAGAPARIINGAGTNITPPQAIGEYTQFYPALSVAFRTRPDPDLVIVGFQHVWRSDDSGDNWTRIGGTPCPSPSPSGNCGIYNDSTIVSVYEAPGNKNYIYAIVSTPSGTKILATFDANSGTSATWHDITQSNLEGGFNSVVVHPTDELTAYLSTNKHIYKTTDAGDTWTTDTPVTLANSIFRDVVFHPANPEKILAASHRGIFARVNGIWGSMNTGLPQGMAFSNLSFNQYSHQLAASAWGRGVYLIDLDRVPPTATITFPANGAHVRGTVTVLGTALDNHRVADAQFKLDGANLGGGIQAPPSNVSVNWNTTSATNASHVLTLLVHDSYGTPTTSASVTVIVDNSAPTVAITEPEDGKKVAGTVTVSADASDNTGVAGVQFMIDGNELDVEDISAPFSIEWDTTSLDNGEHRLRATARDAAGNTRTSDGVTVNVAN